MVDVVDIDPEVIAIAKRYFQVPEDARMRLVAKDGRRFVQEATDTYDLVFLDAYNSDTIPFHLTTREFYQEIKARLTPGGVVVSNIIGTLRGPAERLLSIHLSDPVRGLSYNLCRPHVRSERRLDSR